jgi:hypothetical protein
LNKDIESILTAKNFKISKDKSTLLIDEFEKTSSSEVLFDFLQSHNSCRIIFNSAVKTGDFLPTIDIDEIYPKLGNLFKNENASFIYNAKCKICGADIDSVFISENDFKILGTKKRCPKCRHDITLQPQDFIPLTKVSKNDLIRFLNDVSIQKKVILSFSALACIYCEKSIESIAEDIHDVNLRCSCGRKRYVIPQYLFDDPITKLIKNKHGYWFAWYTWKQLNQFNAENSLILTNKQNKSIKYNADVCFAYKNKLIVIECKDTSDIEDVKQKVALINEIADIFVLATTSKVDQDSLEFISGELKNKFQYVTLKDVDNLSSVIEAFLKSKTRASTLFDGF